MASIEPRDRRLSVAPMMDWTDRHCRYFHRLLAPSAILYTEMVTTGAIRHGDRDHLLGFDPAEHPLALQLGGSEPHELAECARIAAQRGYDEVNLNVGCPSGRVQQGRFGACLMLEPQRVRDAVAAMRSAAGIPVTVKARLGVDDHDSYAHFSDFIHCVAESGCRTFIVHARKAWLSGLSPRENRELPELRYDWVYRLKHECPELVVIINGGISSAAECLRHLEQVDGVMLGRAAYHSPWVLWECQAALGGPGTLPDRKAAVRAMVEYARRQKARGVAVRSIGRHMLGLFQGLPGARQWRRYLSERLHGAEADEGTLLDALQQMETQLRPARVAA